MSTKIRAVAVSYLNTKPMTFSFEKGALADQLELDFKYPSLLADELISGRADIGLVPVAMIPSIPNAKVISNYCIATEGEVASVCIFSQVPLEDVENLMLDYQSRSSVALTKILLKEYWKLSPNLVASGPGYEDKVSERDAALIIGDRALVYRKKYNYIYDLGLAWKAMTGLPFVFAAWVSNKDLNTDFIAEFNKSIAESMNHIDEIVASNSFPDYDLHHYYRKNINYDLNDEKRRAVELFLEYLND